MDMRKLVGRNVKRVRLEKGLTQEQLAELSGFSQQYLRVRQEINAQLGGWVFGEMV
jgi:predicted transcriptional regulator